MESELRVIQKTYELYKYITLTNTTIPRVHRYTLGEKTLICNLMLLEKLVMAKHAPKTQKTQFLLGANAQLEIMRFHLRLYLDLKLVSETSVFQLQAQTREIGRMLGGWLKSMS